MYLSFCTWIFLGGYRGNSKGSLPRLVEQLGAQSFLDVPCGDFRWMNGVSLIVDQYIGADIVLPLIKKNQIEFGDRGKFIQLDLLRDQLPSADIIFCRDCFMHLSFREVKLALNNIKKTSSKYLFTTTFPDHEKNIDTVSPYWRELNLELSPFNFPAPIHLLRDHSERQVTEVNDQGKYIGIWRIHDLK